MRGTQAEVNQLGSGKRIIGNQALPATGARNPRPAAAKSAATRTGILVDLSWNSPRSSLRRDADGEVLSAFGDLVDDSHWSSDFHLPFDLGVSIEDKSHGLRVTAATADLQCERVPAISDTGDFAVHRFGLRGRLGGLGGMGRLLGDDRYTQQGYTCQSRSQQKFANHHDALPPRGRSLELSRRPAIARKNCGPHKPHGERLLRGRATTVAQAERERCRLATPEGNFLPPCCGFFSQGKTLDGLHPSAARLAGAVRVPHIPSIQRKPEVSRRRFLAQNKNTCGSPGSLFYARAAWTCISSWIRGGASIAIAMRFPEPLFTPGPLIAGMGLERRS